MMDPILLTRPELAWALTSPVPRLEAKAQARRGKKWR